MSLRSKFLRNFYLSEESAAPTTTLNEILIVLNRGDRAISDFALGPFYQLCKNI